MMAKERLLQSEMFYISHLDTHNVKDREDIAAFKIDAPEGQGLSEYIKGYACREDKKALDM